MINQILNIVQIVLAVLLILVILLQQKGSGLGSAFGGSGTVYTTRRGLDKVLYQATIVISILFFILAIANLIVV
ncbi:MAG: preprotein translocase subunit SecG [Candidatus Magasanikbacteria bacterium]